MNDKEQIQPLRQESLELETKLDADKTTCDRILAENAKTEAEVKRKIRQHDFYLEIRKTITEEHRKRSQE